MKFIFIFDIIKKLLIIFVKNNKLFIDLSKFINRFIIFYIINNFIILINTRLSFDLNGFFFKNSIIYIKFTIIIVINHINRTKILPYYHQKVIYLI